MEVIQLGNVMIVKSKFKNYEVEFRSKLSSVLLKLNKNSIYIIDKNVYEIFFVKNFKLKRKILINPTEKSKDFFNIYKIIDSLFRLKIKKNDNIICVGGGILQDITSFISSIIFRGVEWFYLPTTIIGQCDSCIGGKTSINYRGVKNQLGNFYPPKKIYIVNEFIQNVNKKNLFSGIGEMAHYFYIAGGNKLNFFIAEINNLLKKKLIKLPTLIKKSLEIKKYFIEVDEFDEGKRLILNYGHSFGHALEKYFSNKISHGIAVAHGMNVANFLSYKFGFMSYKIYIKNEDNLKKIFKKKYLNININKYFNILELDKKNSKGVIKVVLSKMPGKMFIYKIRNKNLLKSYLNEYFNK